MGYEWRGMGNDYDGLEVSEGVVEREGGEVEKETRRVAEEAAWIMSGVEKRFKDSAIRHHTLEEINQGLNTH